MDAARGVWSDIGSLRSVSGWLQWISIGLVFLSGLLQVGKFLVDRREKVLSALAQAVPPPISWTPSCWYSRRGFGCAHEGRPDGGRRLMAVPLDQPFPVVPVLNARSASRSSSTVSKVCTHRSCSFNVRMKR